MSPATLTQIIWTRVVGLDHGPINCMNDDDDDGVSMFNFLMIMLFTCTVFFSIGKLETLFLIRLGSPFAFLNVLGHNLGSINPSTQKNACTSLTYIHS